MKEEFIKAVEQAIKMEKEAYNLYISLMKKTTHINLKKLFQTLALQELKHEILFTEFLRTRDFIEANEKVKAMYINSNLKLLENIKPTADIGEMGGAMLLAIKKEGEAAAHYKMMMNRSQDQYMKDVFYEIMQEELSHARLIRKEYNILFS